MRSTLSTFSRRSHDEAVDWQSMTLPGPEAWSLGVKSKSLGALRRGGRSGIEEIEVFQGSPDGMKWTKKFASALGGATSYDAPSWSFSEATGISMKKSSSSKKILVVKADDAGGCPLDHEESDDTEKLNKKISGKSRSMTRKERHAAFRKGATQELQQHVPRSKSAPIIKRKSTPSLHDLARPTEVVDPRDSSDQFPLGRKQSIGSTRAEDADGSTIGIIDSSDFRKQFHAMELTKLPAPGNHSPPAPPAQTKPGEEMVQSEQVEHSTRKSAQKSKKSKRNKNGGVRAQPGDLIPLDEHGEAQEAARETLVEAQTERAIALLEPPVPEPLSPSSPMPPTSGLAQSFATLRNIDVPKPVSRMFMSVSNEALHKDEQTTTIDAILAPDKVRSRPSSAAVGGSRLADPNMWNIGFDDNGPDGVWDGCKDIYCAWGGGDDWAQEANEWPDSEALYAWE